MEAWIEMMMVVGMTSGVRRSPPSWRRGLKYKTGNQNPRHLYVASFMEAWIEICNLINSCAAASGRLLHGGVDWNQDECKDTKNIFCRLLHGGVDWNILHSSFPEGIVVASFMEAWIEIFSWHRWYSKPPCRLLHGGVDWNHEKAKEAEKKKRRLLHGGVDWNIWLSLQRIKWQTAHQIVSFV